MPKAERPASRPRDNDRICNFYDGRKSDTSTKERRLPVATVDEPAFRPLGTSKKSENHTAKKSRRTHRATEPTKGGSLTRGGQPEEAVFRKKHFFSLSPSEEIDGIYPNGRNESQVINPGSDFWTQARLKAGKDTPNSFGNSGQKEQTAGAEEGQVPINPGPCLGCQRRLLVAEEAEKTGRKQHPAKKA